MAPLSYYDHNNILRQNTTIVCRRKIFETDGEENIWWWRLLELIRDWLCFDNIEAGATLDTLMRDTRRDRETSLREIAKYS